MDLEKAEHFSEHLIEVFKLNGLTTAEEQEVNNTLDTVKLTKSSMIFLL